MGAEFVVLWLKLTVPMVSISFTTPIIRNPKLIAAEVDGDLVMMSIEEGEYFGISGVGSRVWELLATPTTVADIARALCTEYSVDEAVGQSDALAFVEELIQLGLASAV